MKTVIVINGKPRAGKDTSVSMMRELLGRAGIRVGDFSSIDPVKQMLLDYVDLSKKTEADRKLLATVGDALQEHSQFRTQMSMFHIGEFFGKRYGVFFLHMREPALIEKVKGLCEAKGIRLIRVYLASTRAEDVTSNAADAGVENGDYDVLMANDGTLTDIYATCRRVLQDQGLL